MFIYGETERPIKIINKTLNNLTQKYSITLEVFSSLSLINSFRVRFVEYNDKGVL